MTASSHTKMTPVQTKEQLEQNYYNRSRAASTALYTAVRSVVAESKRDTLTLTQRTCFNDKSTGLTPSLLRKALESAKAELEKKDIVATGRVRRVETVKTVADAMEYLLGTV